MLYNNIAELAKTCPELNVTVKLGELIEAVEYCVGSTRSSLEQIIQDEAQEKYLSIEKTCELLGINKSTAWRWSKQNYLIPVKIGMKTRYKKSDFHRQTFLRRSRKKIQIINLQQH